MTDKIYQRLRRHTRDKITWCVCIGLNELAASIQKLINGIYDLRSTDDEVMITVDDDEKKKKNFIAIIAHSMIYENKSSGRIRNHRLRYSMIYFIDFGQDRFGKLELLRIFVEICSLFPWMIYNLLHTVIIPLTAHTTLYLTQFRICVANPKYLYIDAKWIRVWIEVRVLRFVAVFRWMFVCVCLCDRHNCDFVYWVRSNNYASHVGANWRLKIQEAQQMRSSKMIVVVVWEHVAQSN